MLRADATLGAFMVVVTFDSNPADDMAMDTEMEALRG